MAEIIPEKVGGHGGASGFKGSERPPTKDEEVLFHFRIILGKRR